MNYPVFIFHELVLRFSDINREIGKYISSTVENGECLINTTTGHIKVALTMLEKQYNNPRSISKEELQQLATEFEIG
ncbi:hypothetical protein EZ428_08895 [Pedobacter frigiditerrae]|uniref:Uncharacterized protein n=1 Tax=Pedobacter frigiditerrae TaxID=2530452 RepID=A0A4R0MX91_9SPHI|nr:hypothetical protein [Pedobacter frigiditerrae]TCC91855.1 hypothetical protein EZ428_08895 [Pedobacter frigiditerrae]